jgi:hypothetical protein
MDVRWVDSSIAWHAGFRNNLFPETRVTAPRCFSGRMRDPSGFAKRERRLGNRSISHREKRIP